MACDRPETQASAGVQTPGTEGAEAPLGIYGKYSAAQKDQRREKFALQSAARQLRQGLAVTRCFRWAVPKRHIAILHASAFGRAFYSGLETCGSVWECPICASKISERRRVEVQTAMALHKAAGGAVLLLTLTNPHTLGDDLCGLLAAQAKAIDAFRKNRPGRSFFESLGLVGSIRALEVTYGSNGWHPHFHLLLFVTGKVDLPKAYLRAYQIWLDCCMNAGLGVPSFKHGVSLEDGSKAEKYISKWGLENEVTKGHIKKGKKNSRTPFDLLRCYKDGDKQAGALFVQYADTFKGKRQLFWSHGLKKRFGIEDATDREVAEREEEEAEHGCDLSRDDWKLVLQHGARAEFLEAFEQGGAFEVANCLAILRGDVLPGSPAERTTEDLQDLAVWMGWSPERLAEFVAYNAARLEVETCQLPDNG